jgi:hypothetical protein
MNDRTDWTELLPGSGPDEWCVALNGERAVSFCGPRARTYAEQQRAELEALLSRLNVNAPDSADDPTRD